MTITITVADVQAILPTSTQLTTAQITAAIGAADCVIERLATGCGEDLSDACLTQVGIYLTAHFAAVMENTLTLKSEKDDCANASVTYGFEFGQGIMGTPFGQMANTLSGGCLAEQDKTPTGIFAIGSI